jgi:hypothetical protein
MSRHIVLAGLSVHHCHNFLQGHLSGLIKDIRRIFLCVSSHVISTQLCSIALKPSSVPTAVRIWSWEMDSSWTGSSSFLAYTFTLLHSFRFHLWRYYRTEIYATADARREQWRSAQHSASEIKNTAGIVECLRVSFHAELRYASWIWRSFQTLTGKWK